MHFGIEKFKQLLPAATVAGVVETLMGLSDSVVAGHVIGEGALAGVNLLSPVLTAVTFVSSLLGVGMAVNYAVESGRCNRARAEAIFSQGVWCAALAGGAICLALWCLRGPFLAFMAPGEEVAGHAFSYWGWYFIAAAFEPLAVLLVNASMADGDSRLCFICYAIQLGVNASISYVTTKYWSMGVGGCAFGTLVANLCAIAILCCHFLRASNTFRLRLHFRFGDALRIVKSSLGDSSSFLCTAALFFVLEKLVISRFGTGTLPALSAVICVIGFLEVFNGVGNALAPILTVYFGERNPRAIRMLMRAATKWSLGEGLALSLVLAAFPQLVTFIVGIDDPELAAQAAHAVRCVAGGLVFYSLVYLYNSYYIFIGRETLAVAVTVLNGFLLPVLLVSTLGALGVSATWLSLALAPATALVGFGAFLFLRWGRGMFPLLLSRERDGKIEMFDLDLTPEKIAVTSEAVAGIVRSVTGDESRAMRASLITEEVFMAVLDRNGSRHVLAEANVDWNEGIRLTLRDDGEIFDITDTDQQVSSLRTFIVASIMERQPSRANLITTGFNRNVFDF